jgi:hypothetical protein
MGPQIPTPGAGSEHHTSQLRRWGRTYTILQSVPSETQVSGRSFSITPPPSMGLIICSSELCSSTRRGARPAYARGQGLTSISNCRECKRDDCVQQCEISGLPPPVPPQAHLCFPLTPHLQATCLTRLESWSPAALVSYPNSQELQRTGVSFPPS